LVILLSFKKQSEPLLHPDSQLQDTRKPVIIRFLGRCEARRERITWKRFYETEGIDILKTWITREKPPKNSDRTKKEKGNGKKDDKVANSPA
jgi:hypothetical protein